jgi:hypothetical protein
MERNGNGLNIYFSYLDVLFGYLKRNEWNGK